MSEVEVRSFPVLKEFGWNTVSLLLQISKNCYDASRKNEEGERKTEENYIKTGKRP